MNIRCILSCAFALCLAAVAYAGEAEKIVLFNGKDLSGWTLRNPNLAETWKVFGGAKLNPDNPKELVGVAEGDGVMLRGKIDKGSDIFTDKQLGDGLYHIEFMVPKGSNSGIYPMGQYEVQVLDSYGKPDDKLGQGDVGAIYSAAKPTSNASKPAGEWQTFDIVFKAPRFDADGKKTQNALFVSVKLNGKTIQENVEVKGPTGGQLPGGEKSLGPLMFQGDHGIVAFRNVWFQPMPIR